MAAKAASPGPLPCYPPAHASRYATACARQALPAGAPVVARMVPIPMSITSQPGEHLTPSGPDPRPAFVAMFEAVRAYLLTDGAAPEARAAVATNPKGEATRAFDARAEEIALAVARLRLRGCPGFRGGAGTLPHGAGPPWGPVLASPGGANNS